MRRNPPWTLPPSTPTAQTSSRGPYAAHLQLEVVLELLLDVGADADDVVAGDLRDPLQEEDAVDDLFGVLHLAHGLFVVLLGQVGVAPVLAHLGLAEVLVDGRQLDG